MASKCPGQDSRNSKAEIVKCPRCGYDVEIFSDEIKVNLGGGTASRSPFQREPDYTSGSLPPFLGRGMKPRPATEGSYPLGFPNDRLPAASRGAYSPIVKCAKCKKSVYRERIPSCVDWCPEAKECVGEKKWKEIKALGLSSRGSSPK